VQMGCNRAGWYSWDRLDHGGIPSEARIHPEWQHIEVGDRLASTPSGNTWFDVAAVQPQRLLALRAPLSLGRWARPFDTTGPRPRFYAASTWCFLLQELPDGHTRLVVSGYANSRPRPLTAAADFLFWEPAHWIMQTRQLTNVKRRAEQNAPVETDHRAGVHTPKSHDGVSRSASATPIGTGVYLYWLPLGAGGHCVRLNGRVFEAVLSRLEHRAACDLYHSALQVRVPEGRFVIEQTPVPDGQGARRGVATGGAVGAHWAARFRILRYEVRRWRDGLIPDANEAVDSPRRLTDDPDCARRLLELVPSLPTLVWGRDELAAGEMWNSNAVISWLIASAGLRPESIQPPAGGRAPGWKAGYVVARRRQAATEHVPTPSARKVFDEVGARPTVGGGTLGSRLN
jgi:hypothetical protein